MTQVHPSFDAETQTWFLDGGPEAPTIRQLHRLLPPGTRVRDYYPRGYGVVDWGSYREKPRAGAPVSDRIAEIDAQLADGREKRRLAKEAARSASTSVVQHAHRDHWTTVGEERLTKLMSNGRAPGSVARVMGLSKDAVQAKAKRMGLKFVDKRGGRSRHHDHDKILDLWRMGVSGREIADRVGTTPSVLYSVISIARANQDPRATRRNCKISRKASMMGPHTPPQRVETRDVHSADTSFEVPPGEHPEVT